MKGQKSLDEFAFILLGSIIFIMVLAIYFTQQEVSQPEEINYTKNATKTLSKFSVFIASRVNVSISNDTKIFDEIDQTIIEKGYFSEKSISLLLPQATNNTKRVTIEFLVRDTNNAGNLEVYVNGLKIWSKKASPGIYTIEVPIQYIKGNNNYIKIKATNPGWKFWMKTAYVIEYAKVIVTETEKEKEEISFFIDKKVLDKAEYAELTFQKFPSIETSNLIIEINNNIIYNKRPFTRVQEIEIDKNILKGGDNRIEFYVNGEAYYDIRDIKILLYYR